MFSIRNILILVVIVLVGIVGYLFLRPEEKQEVVEEKNVPLVEVQIDEVEESESNNYEVFSPDGEWKLEVEKTTSGETSSYVFYTSKVEGDERFQIFEKKIPKESNILIPQNTFSPDNKYVFIKEENGLVPNYYVFRADGEEFIDSNRYIDVVPIYNAKETGFGIQEITGWDSNTLLHILTRDEENKKGPNFWFEIPSGAVIRLVS